MLQLPWPVLTAAIVIAMTGAAIQAALGFGLAMVAAPLLLLVDAEFIPGPLIATAMLTSFWMAWQERHAIDYATLKPAIAGRLVGSPPAALLLGTLSAATFELIFAVLVLAAVAMSMVRSNLQPTRRSIFLATAVGGFMGTLSGIGGPPVALVYQHARGPQLRANLSVLFTVGTSISLAAVALSGRYGVREILLTLPLLTGVLLGLKLGTPLRHLLDQRSARPFLLGLCTLSSLIVLGRALFGVLSEWR